MTPAEHFDPMTFAQETLDVWGLTTWTLRWDRAKRRAGACDHARNQIRLSKPLFDVFPEDAQRNVILHEVAHALVGPQHKHDRRWKQAAIMLGAQPRALLPSSLPEPECSWVGRCQRCGAERRLHSAPRRVMSCASCCREFDLDLIFAWYHHGHPEIPPGRYAKELTQIRRQRRFS